MHKSAILPAIAALACLAGCRPAPTATSPTLPPSQPRPASVSARADLPEEQFLGAWSANDDQGQSFDMILFPNRQAVSTWTKGTAGAHGERGLWRSGPEGVTIFFHDGWTDRILIRDGGFIHQGFSPDRPLDGKPTNESPATRVEGERSGFVGVWRLNKEPDGNFLYATLQSSGRAFSNINGEGTWKVTPEGALCTWADGWNDLIFRTGEGFRKRAWVGIEESTTPPDLSEAVRVGESRFLVSP